MPRMPRVVVPGLPLHVIQCGNNRQAIFFTDQDYDRFHTDLRTASERFDCVIHASVYMTNHVLCGAPHNTCNVKFRIM
jgi:putative transposase